MVALPPSTNTIKHDTEKINKCVAVSSAKTNLETKEHQLSWQWGVVSYSSWKSEATEREWNPIVFRKQNQQIVVTSLSKLQNNMQRGYWLGILKPQGLKGRLSTWDTEAPESERQVFSRSLQRWHALCTLRTCIFQPASHIKIHLRNRQAIALRQK